MCVNDMMALGAINALSGSGIDVPGKISVVGYDNVAYSTVSAIPITTINQNLELVARGNSVASKARNRRRDHLKGPELHLHSA